MDEIDTDGAAAIAAFDQQHAAAMESLSRARAFLLVVDEGKGRFASAAAALGASATEFLTAALIIASAMTRQSVHDLLREDESDDAREDQ